MLKCPDCGKEGFKHQGALNLHRSVHCPKKKQQKIEDECAGGCDYRLLNPRNGVEYNAMKAGYKEVCDKCLNVR